MKLSKSLFITIIWLSFMKISAQNGIYDPEASGKDVVESALERIVTSCIFSDDKGLLRRIAYVETFDGKAANTFPPNYHGGIWKVDESMFQEMKSTDFMTSMATYIAEVKNLLNVDWSTVAWTDLRIPFNCALGARFYIGYKTRNVAGEVPRSLSAQAAYWKSYYRPSGDVQHFLDIAGSLEGVDKCKPADTIFLLDSSGSIGTTNWAQEKAFVVQVVQQMDVGADKNRIGIINYSSGSSYDIKLNSYFEKSTLIAAIQNLRYQNGGTATNLALDQLARDGFLEQNGARPQIEGNPKIAFLLSDGVSNSMALTLAAAERVKEQKISIYTIGVGNGVREEELVGVASEPKCQKYFYLSDGFNEIEDLVSSIAQAACNAPLVIDPDEGVEIDRPLDPGEEIDCSLNVPVQGVTVKISAHSGSVDYYLARDTYPSSAYYEFKMSAKPGQKAVIYIPSSTRRKAVAYIPSRTHQKHLKSDTEETIFCNIKANDTDGANITIDTDEGHEDWCQSQPCINNGACVDNGDTYLCDCSFYWTGAHCETPATFNCNDRNPCAIAITSEYGYYFAHDLRTKFVQCDAFGHCFEMNCGAGTEWDDAAKTCGWPKP